MITLSILFLLLSATVIGGILWSSNRDDML